MATKTQTPYYAMFTKTGNKACHSLIMKVIKEIKSRSDVKGKAGIKRIQITKMIQTGMHKISAKHNEIHDTEPESIVQDVINKALDEAGCTFEVNRFDW